VCLFLFFIYFFNNLKWTYLCHVFFRGGEGGNKRSCTAVFCKNWGLHVRRLGVCGYGYIRGYPWVSTENLWIWIWIWMGNFISTASLNICLLLTVYRQLIDNPIQRYHCRPPTTYGLATIDALQTNMQKDVQTTHRT